MLNVQTDFNIIFYINILIIINELFIIKFSYQWLFFSFFEHLFYNSNYICVKSNIFCVLKYYDFLNPVCVFTTNIFSYVYYISDDEL